VQNPHQLLSRHEIAIPDVTLVIRVQKRIGSQLAQSSAAPLGAPPDEAPQIRAEIIDEVPGDIQLRILSSLLDKASLKEQ
jgi:tRNA A37 threonylcarbamoyladenosine synthetase subunit TsaC/SUA5/YrdC